MDNDWIRSSTDFRAAAGWASTAIGIDWTTEPVTRVRAIRSRGKIRWEPMSPGAVAGTDLTSAALSTRESFIRWVEAPLPSLSKARRVFSTLLDIQVPFAVEDCTACFIGAGKARTSGGVAALAVAARVQDIDRRMAALRDSGFDPVVLDHEGVAIWTQAGVEAPPEPGIERPQIVVLLGSTSLTLSLGRGSRLLSSHSLRIADAAQGKRLLLAQFAKERERRPRWVWGGVGAANPQSLDPIRTALEADWPGDSILVDSPATFLARAVACRAIQPGPLRCNLRTGTLEHPALAARSQRMRLATAALLLVAGLVLAGGSGSARMALARHERAIDTSFAALRDSILGYAFPAKGQKAIEAVRRKAQQDQALLAPFVRATREGPSAFLREFTEESGKFKIQIRALSLGENRVDLQGIAPSWNAPESLLQAVRRRFPDAILKRADAEEDARIPFTITAGGTRP
jgi:hypothetical protein